MDSINIVIVGNNREFEKQVTSLLFDLSRQPEISFFYGKENIYLSNLIITDGSCEEIYQTGFQIPESLVPIFIIANEKPTKLPNRINYKFYKKAQFPKKQFITDIYDWLELIKSMIETNDSYINIEHEYTKNQILLKEHKKRLNEAKKLQYSATKPSQVLGFDMAWMYKPVAEISGDFCVVKQVWDKIYVIIGDVVDHGVQAGLYAASLQSLIESYLSLSSPYEQELSNLVSYIRKSCYIYNYGKEDNEAPYFATMLFCEINTKKKYIEFLNCGHERPLILRANGTIDIVEFEEDNISYSMPPIGFKGPIVMQQPVRVPFKLGDGLMVYTDGIIEVFKSNEEQQNIKDIYSIERLTESARYELNKQYWNADSILMGIQKDIDSYCIGSSFESSVHDDMSALIMIWENK